MPQLGSSALHYAAFCGHVDVVKLLMDAGADPVKPSQDNVTPLQSAKEEGHIAVTRLLLGTYTKVWHQQHYSCSHSDEL